MGFLPTWLLWGGIAASVPVVIHFFFRSKYRVVSWAAMDFLRLSIEEARRRLKIQELLLLLLRIALLIILALALALGIIRATSSWGGGGAVDTVFVFDVSASMSAKEGTATRLDVAKKAALEMLDKLPSSSTVQVVTVADRAEYLGPASPTSHDRARALIDSLKPTDLPTDLLPGLMEAGEALRRVHNPNREVYLFGDVQKRGWQAQSSALIEKAKEFDNETTKLFLVRCAKSEPNNAAIVGIRPQSDLLHRGDRAAISVLVRNTGKKTIQNLNVKLSVVGQKEGHDSRSLPSLEPDQTRGVLLSVDLQQAGYIVLRGTIDSDGMAQDNKLEHVVRVHDQLRVLVVDGAPDRIEPDKAGSFYLQQAFQPVAAAKKDNYSVQLRVVPPSEAFPVLLDEADLCVFADVPLKPDLTNKGGHVSDAFLDRLVKFVREGGGLLVLSGPHVKSADYNEALGKKRELLSATLGDVQQAKGDDGYFAAAKKIVSESFLATLREEPLGSLFSQTEIRSLVELKPVDRARTELVTTEGQPLLVSRRVGDGRVVVCATSADLTWNDWALWGHYYVPLWRSVMNELLSGTSDGLNRKVGEPILWQVPTEDADREFLIKNAEDGIELRAHPRLEAGMNRLPIDPLVFAGLYELAAEGKSSEAKVTALHRENASKKPGLFAVAPDWSEGEDLAPMNDGELRRLLGFEPTVLDATAPNMAEGVAEQRRQEWTLLLGVVLALLLVETLFAWFCDRSV